MSESHLKRDLADARDLLEQLDPRTVVIEPIFVRPGVHAPAAGLTPSPAGLIPMFTVDGVVIYGLPGDVENPRKNICLQGWVEPLGMSQKEDARRLLRNHLFCIHSASNKPHEAVAMELFDEWYGRVPYYNFIRIACGKYDAVFEDTSRELNERWVVIHRGEVKYVQSPPPDCDQDVLCYDHTIAVAPVLYKPLHPALSSLLPSEEVFDRLARCRDEFVNSFVEGEGPRIDQLNLPMANATFNYHRTGLSTEAIFNQRTNIHAFQVLNAQFMDITCRLAFEIDALRGESRETKTKLQELITENEMLRCCLQEMYPPDAATLMSTAAMATRSPLTPISQIDSAVASTGPATTVSGGLMPVAEVSKSPLGGAIERTLAPTQLKKEAVEFSNDPSFLAASVDPTENSSGASTVSLKSGSEKADANITSHLAPLLADSGDMNTSSTTGPTTNYVHPSSMIPPSIVGMRDFDNGDPSVRLILAEIRQIGMEILFPSAVHDKVLAVLFVAVRAVPVISYRELLDMVMTVKDAGIISNLEFVSKSKVRGMLSLLKHCHVLLTQVKGPGEQPGYLYLAQAATSFQVMRDWHDDYLLKFMQKLPLTLPESFIAEIVWRFNEEEKFMRLEAVEKLMHKVSNFFAGYLKSTNTKPAMYQHSMAQQKPSAKPRPQQVPYSGQQGYDYFPARFQQYDGGDNEESNWSSRKSTTGYHQNPGYSAPISYPPDSHEYAAPPPRNSAAAYGQQPRDSGASHGYVDGRYRDQGYDTTAQRYQQAPSASSAYPQAYSSQYSEASVLRRSAGGEGKSDNWTTDSSYSQHPGSTHFNEALDAYGKRSIQSYGAPQQSFATQRQSKPLLQGLHSTSSWMENSPLGSTADLTEDLSRSFFSGTRVSAEIAPIIIGELESAPLDSRGVRPPDRSRGTGWTAVQSSSSNPSRSNAPSFGTNGNKPAVQYVNGSSSLSSGYQGSAVSHNSAWGNSDVWPAGYSN